MAERETVYTHRTRGGKVFLTVEIDGPTRHSIVRTTDAVVILVYVRDRDEVVLVDQYRPAAVNDDNPSGSVVETVAGRFDYETSLKALVVAELEEEAGITVTEEEVEILNFGKSLHTSPGVLTERIYFAYVEVDSSRVDPEDRVRGVGDEKIRRRFVPRKELPSFVFDTVTSFGLVHWFLNRSRKGV